MFYLEGIHKLLILGEHSPDRNSMLLEANMEGGLAVLKRLARHPS